MRTRSILAYNAGEGESTMRVGRKHSDVAVSSRPLLSTTECLISHLSACAFVLISQSAYLS